LATITLNTGSIVVNVKSGFVIVNGRRG